MFQGLAIDKRDKLISCRKMLWPGQSVLMVPNLCINSMLNVMLIHGFVLVETPELKACHIGDIDFTQ